MSRQSAGLIFGDNPAKRFDFSSPPARCVEEKTSYCQVMGKARQRTLLTGDPGTFGTGLAVLPGTVDTLYIGRTTEQELTISAYGTSVIWTYRLAWRVDAPNGVPKVLIGQGGGIIYAVIDGMTMKSDGIISQGDGLLIVRLAATGGVAMGSPLAIAGTPITANAITVSDAGELYLTGSFSGSITIGSTRLASRSAAAFWAKVVSTVLWVGQLVNGTDASSAGRGIVLDSSGRLYLGGNFAGTISLSSVSLTATVSSTASSSGAGPFFLQLAVDTGAASGLMQITPTSGSLLMETMAIDGQTIYYVATFPSSGTVTLAGGEADDETASGPGSFIASVAAPNFTSGPKLANVSSGFGFSLAILDRIAVSYFNSQGSEWSTSSDTLRLENGGSLENYSVMVSTDGQLASGGKVCGVGFTEGSYLAGGTENAYLNLTATIGFNSWRPIVRVITGC